MGNKRISLIDCLISGSYSYDGYILDKTKQKNNIIESISANIESLFNSKKIDLSLYGQDKNLEKSILNYGLKDFSGLFFDSIRFMDQVCVEMKNAIILFEPRLDKVNVYYEPESKNNNSIYFYIESELNNFDTKIIYFVEMIAHNRSFKLINSKGL